MSSYYPLLFLVDVQTAGDGAEMEDDEIIEFSWVAYDVAQRCATEHARYSIRLEYSQLSETKLQHRRGGTATAEDGHHEITLADAIHQFDSVLFSTFEKSRKPICLASFYVAKFYKLLNSDAVKKDITLYAHYEHYVDIARLVEEFEDGVTEEDLRSIRQIACKLGVGFGGDQETAMENCQIASHILTQMFLKGLCILKEHRIALTSPLEISMPLLQSLTTLSEEEAIIRLRGLPWEVDEAQLIKFVAPVCPVAASNIHVVTGPDGRANGEAYVVLPNMEYRDKAIRDLHGKMIGKRWVEVFNASVEEFKRYKHSRKPTSGNGVVADEAILRLRGLPWSCNEYEIVNFFRTGGFDITVDEVVMGYTSNNRLSGEAWVVMGSVQEAETARMALHKKAIGRRYIEIFSSSRDEMHQAKHHRPVPVELISTASSRHKYFGRNASNSTPFGFTVIRLRGLPFHANVSHIMNFFSGMQISAVLPVANPSSSRPSGEAFVQFVDAEEAWAAYNNKNGHLIDKRYIELFPSSVQEMEHVTNNTILGSSSLSSFRKRHYPY